MIDIHSGFVWGVEDAADPIQACQQMDQSLGVRDRDYELHGPNSNANRTGRTGYVVHEAPAGFDVEDGQCAVDIEAVEALPRVAIVTVD